MVQGYDTNFIAWDEAGRIRMAEDKVRDMLYQFAAQRRPSIRALKLTGTCLHPARIG